MLFLKFASQAIFVLHRVFVFLFCFYLFTFRRNYAFVIALSSADAPDLLLRTAIRFSLLYALHLCCETHVTKNAHPFTYIQFVCSENIATIPRCACVSLKLACARINYARVRNWNGNLERNGVRIVQKYSCSAMSHRIVCNLYAFDVQGKCFVYFLFFFSL